MSTISEGKFDGESDKKVKEYVRLLGNQSIEYRLVRSQYYRENFFNGLKALRIERIEGYQPYDDFVRRRLQSAFAFIDSIERRLSDAQTEWRSVDQIFLSTIITKLTSEIDGTQKSITNAHKKANEIQGEIERIQKWGELALLLFLIPYYFNNLILESIDCDKGLKDNWCNSNFSWGSFNVPHQRMIVFFFWVFFIAVGIIRFPNKQKNADNKVNFEVEQIN